MKGVALGGVEEDREKRRKLRVFSPEYYAVCGLGGMFSAGATHFAVTPLDVLKVNMQVNPLKYNSIFSGLNILVKEQGPSSLWRGWGGKLFGYGAQGGCKFGLYEYFKKTYSDVFVGQDRSLIFLFSSASAQVIADVALCPFEAVKVRVQTEAKFAKGLVDGFPKLYTSEGLSGFYKGLFPLWGRNLPFSVIMFTSFEHSVDLLYRNVIQKKKEDCSRAQQLGVTCIAGYASGAIGTIISNPADNIVALLYNKKFNNIWQAVKSIGFSSLFTRSLPIRFALVGPVVTLQWFFYDTIKVLTGLYHDIAPTQCHRQRVSTTPGHVFLLLRKGRRVEVLWMMNYTQLRQTSRFRKTAEMLVFGLSFCSPSPLLEHQ